MKCTLMHKRTKVAEMELDDATGYIQKIGAVYAPEHLPVGVPVRRGANRPCGAERVVDGPFYPHQPVRCARSTEMLEINSPKNAAGTLLWTEFVRPILICPEGSDLTWDRINFFGNDFSEDIGDVLFGADKKADGLDFSSPDNTSDGNLKKRWKIINGKRCLVKGGSNPFRQQPFNEAIAAGIMERLDIPHVPYTVTWNKGAPYSVCEDFVTENTELVSAWRILKTQKGQQHLNVPAFYKLLRGARHSRNGSVPRPHDGAGLYHRQRRPAFQQLRCAAGR
ncbi:MAG: hypothetical protein ACLR23_05835 [Clostridia bacterium]